MQDVLPKDALVAVMSVLLVLAFVLNLVLLSLVLWPLNRRTALRPFHRLLALCPLHRYPVTTRHSPKHVIIVTSCLSQLLTASLHHAMTLRLFASRAGSDAPPASCSAVVLTELSAFLFPTLTRILVAVATVTETLKVVGVKPRRGMVVGVASVAGGVAYCLVVVVPVFFFLYLQSADQPCYPGHGTILRYTTSSSEGEALAVVTYVIPSVAVLLALASLGVAHRFNPPRKAAAVSRRQSSHAALGSWLSRLFSAQLRPAEKDGGPGVAKTEPGATNGKSNGVFSTHQRPLQVASKDLKSSQALDQPNNHDGKGVAFPYDTLVAGVLVVALEFVFCVRQFAYWSQVDYRIMSTDEWIKLWAADRVLSLISLSALPCCWFFDPYIREVFRPADSVSVAKGNPAVSLPQNSRPAVSLPQNKSPQRRQQENSPSERSDNTSFDDTSHTGVYENEPFRFRQFENAGFWDDDINAAEGRVNTAMNGTWGTAAYGADRVRVQRHGRNDDPRPSSDDGQGVGNLWPHSAGREDAVSTDAWGTPPEYAMLDRRLTADDKALKDELLTQRQLAGPASKPEFKYNRHDFHGNQFLGPGEGRRHGMHDGFTIRTGALDGGQCFGGHDADGIQSNHGNRMNPNGFSDRDEVIRRRHADVSHDCTGPSAGDERGEGSKGNGTLRTWNNSVLSQSNGGRDDGVNGGRTAVMRQDRNGRDHADTSIPPQRHRGRETTAEPQRGATRSHLGEDSIFVERNRGADHCLSLQDTAVGQNALTQRPARLERNDITPGLSSMPRRERLPNPNQNTPRREITPNRNTQGREITPTNQHTLRPETSPTQSTQRRKITLTERKLERDVSPNEGMQRREITPTQSPYGRDVIPNQNKSRQAGTRRDPNNWRPALPPRNASSPQRGPPHQSAGRQSGTPGRISYGDVLRSRNAPDPEATAERQPSSSPLSQQQPARPHHASRSQARSQRLEGPQGQRGRVLQGPSRHKPETEQRQPAYPETPKGTRLPGSGWTATPGHPKGIPGRPREGQIGSCFETSKVNFGQGQGQSLPPFETSKVNFGRGQGQSLSPFETSKVNIGRGQGQSHAVGPPDVYLGRATEDRLYRAVGTGEKRGNGDVKGRYRGRESEC